jgi:photosystem II stability/assembly factor-like uncharacterized protein
MKSFLLSAVLGAFCNVTLAKSTSDLLDLPATQSTLASKSVLMSMTIDNNTVLAVGERGHIINWQTSDHWTQHQSPVSVAITDVILLSNGSKIAVGHDGIILKKTMGSTTWRKVLTGREITKLKIKQMELKHQALQLVILKTEDEYELEELTYQLDDLAFAMEDNQIEIKSGPNKPLLSVARTAKDILFASGAYGTLLTSIDKGESWELVSNRLDNPDSFHLNSIITTSTDELFIVGENGIGFYSNNLGQTWSTMSLPYSGSLFGIVANTVKDKTQLIAFGLQGNFIVSVDGGFIWQHKKLPISASLLGGSFSKEGTAYLVGHGGLIVSFNPERPESFNISKHPSGAAFSSVLVKEHSLILAGQFGISEWSTKK